MRSTKKLGVGRCFARAHDSKARILANRNSTKHGGKALPDLYAGGEDKYTERSPTDRARLSRRRIG